MMTIKKLFPLLAICLMPYATATESNIKITNAWVQATDTKHNETVAYLTIKSDKTTKLVAVTSNVAQEVEVRETSMENHAPKNREVKSVDIPAGQNVELKPGSYHLVLKGLKKALSEGSNVELTLKFDSSTKNNNSTLSIGDGSFKWRANLKYNLDTTTITFNAAVKKLAKSGS